MAMENRFARRILGEAVDGAIRTAMKQKQERFARVILPSQASTDAGVAYILLILAYPVEYEARGGLKGGYDQYRRVRAKMLEAYCLTVLHDHRHLNTVVLSE
jgi:hypothetical protein